MMQVHLSARFLLLALVVPACAAAASVPASMPAFGPPDDAVFREGLRQRGLTSWLGQYLAETPADAVDSRLREREALLEAATTRPAADPVRADLLRRAHDILENLLQNEPRHPGRLHWLLEAARDRLERQHPASFDAILLYELPGSDRTRVRQLTDATHQALDAYQRESRAAWEILESLDEATIERMTTTGLTWPLQSMDEAARLLDAWSRMYGLLVSDAPADDRRSGWESLLADVTERYGWTQPIAGREVFRCNALAIAAVAARNCGRFDEADRFAREVVAALKDVSVPADRQRLQSVALLGVLEQIRTLRDSGKASDALNAVDQARGWVQRTRAGDLQAAVAIALTECQLRLRGRSPASNPQEPVSTNQTPEPVNLFAGDLQPLERIASGTPMQRDFLYQTIAGAVTPGLRLPSSTLGVQLAAGGALSGGMPDQALIRSIAAELRRVLGGPGLVDPQRGELAYLLGRCDRALGRRAESIEAYCRLVEQNPSHDRATAAATEALREADAWIREPGAMENTAARKAFLQAAAAYRQVPHGSVDGSLPYVVAVLLEREGRLEEAAAEYQRVPDGQAETVRARIGRARCFRELLSRATASAPAGAELARATAEAGRAAVAAAQRLGPGGDPCLQVEATLLLAGVLNDDAVGRSDEALSVLGAPDSTTARCPEAVGPALRERIRALRQLRRMAEARKVVEELLQADTDQAGPVMAGLLEAIGHEVESALDHGQVATAASVAAEGAQLAASLQLWAEQHPDRVTPVEQFAIRLRGAWCLLQAGRLPDALRAYDACWRAITSETEGLRVEVTLGRAECLVGQGQYQEALGIFSPMWQSALPQSPAWWRALAGSLQCHTRLGGDAGRIVQTIRQQRHLAPDLGGPRWKRAFEALEAENLPKTSRPG